MNRPSPRSSLISNYTTLAWPVRLLAIFLITAIFMSLNPGDSGRGGGLFGVPVVHAQSTQNVIAGIVVNGTDGGVVPEDLEVLLLTVDDAAGQIIEQESKTVNPDGTFAFGNLVSGPGVTFRVVANSGDYTPSVDLTNVDDWSNVRLTIYDETTSLEDVSVSSYVMMIPTIDARSRQVGVLTVVNISNRGDKVWLPDLSDPGLTGLDLLRFNLPDGFSDLSVESELPTGNILQIDTGFAMTNPIPPGDAAILMTYIIPYEGDGFDFTLKLPYGADQVRLLLPDGGGAITGGGLGSVDSVVVAESVFNSVEGNDYPAGAEIAVEFSGMPQPTTLQALSDFFQGRTYVIVIIWLVGIALLGILGYALYSSRKSAAESGVDDDELASRADIVAEIAALDEEFESGTINEDKYQYRREELKQLALEIEDAAPGTYLKYAGEPEEPEK
ncbi:MAG: hypothetical protein O6922_05165 [Chloroflexi bacterium]|nr:hypothetical protein [Chloroflexota bacterium]